jgi:hypothetical protein
MQAYFPAVMFGAIGLFVLVGVLSMLTRRNLHDQIGQGGLDIGEERFGGGLPFHGPGASGGALGPDGDGGAGGGLWSSDERQLEIRQMLTARSNRLVRQGLAPLDIEAELARIDGNAGDPAADSHDAALAEEVRQLVRARNERRARQGLEALDVEAEVQRTLAQLNP